MLQDGERRKMKKLNRQQKAANTRKLQASIEAGKAYIVVEGPAAITPAPILTLCGQLESVIQELENRISNAIAKINSLM